MTILSFTITIVTMGDKMRYILSVLCFVGTIYTVSGINYVVNTASGSVRGVMKRTQKDGVLYRAFMGIPYAQPPINDLRFKAPVPVEPWVGVKDTVDFGAQCYAHVPAGLQSEDCLFVNVYTPALTQWERPKAVMVFIFGGGFYNGSSNDYKPDFLVDNDVILVTFNYRIGPLGFLNLGTADVPGNAGFKDMLLALQWVKQNIAAFGGDTKRITLFGNRCLISSAILQSGTSFMHGSLQSTERAIEHANKLASAFPCSVSNVKDVYDCFMNLDPDVLSYGQAAAFTPEDTQSLVFTVYTPSIEPDLPGAFITQPPLSEEFNPVPIILGTTDREGLFLLPIYNSMDPSGTLTFLFGLNMGYYLPSDLAETLTQDQKEEVYVQIRQFYFDGQNITLDNRMKLIESINDKDFRLDTQKLALTLTSKYNAKVYNYQIIYDGAFCTMKSMSHIKARGVAHADELGYLFNVPWLQSAYQSFDRNSSHYRMVDKLTKLWTNFAKYNDPTKTLDNVVRTKWEPFTTDVHNYLEIGDELTLKQGLSPVNMKFWNDIYEKYQNRRPLPE